MTRLAGYVDVGPGRSIVVTCKIEVLLEVGRVAAGAHIVPGLVPPRPMHWIGGRQFPIRVELEPALTTVFPPAAVPGDTQRLKPAAGKADQVLLQGINPESEGNLIVVWLSVSAFRSHHEGLAGAAEAGYDPVLRLVCVVERTNYRV